SEEHGAGGGDLAAVGDGERDVGSGGDRRGIARRGGEGEQRVRAVHRDGREGARAAEGGIGHFHDAAAGEGERAVRRWREGERGGRRAGIAQRRAGADQEDAAVDDGGTHVGAQAGERERASAVLGESEVAVGRI